MVFDGRSHSKPLEYTFFQRLIIRFSMDVMPLLTHFMISDRLNTLVWRLLGCKVGKAAIIRKGTVINAPFMLSLGDYTAIHGTLKSRGGIRLGAGVELVEEVYITTQSHNLDTELFESMYSEVIIEDNCWIGPRAIILPGLKLNRGAIVAAGAVLTRDAEAWSAYGGVPAKFIKRRVPMKSGESS